MSSNQDCDFVQRMGIGMRIDPALASMIARHAVLEPYRQIDPMPTEQFVQWLNKRDISIGDWRTLHHLWEIGLLLPVAVQSSTSDGKPNGIVSAFGAERFIPVGRSRYGDLFADTGVAVAPSVSLQPSKKAPYLFRDAALWHPFQLWLFDRLDRWHIRINSGWGSVLAGPTRFRQSRTKWWNEQLDSVRAFCSGESVESFSRLLALLLAAEPLVHGKLFRTVRVNPLVDDVDGYYKWRDSQLVSTLLENVRLSNVEITKWHRALASCAHSQDPVASLRDLLHHIDRDVREKMTGRALKAHELYDAAEILRRFGDRYLDLSLPEESAIAGPEDAEWVNNRRYGTPRPTDYQRRSFLRITRHFGVDAGYRSCLFLEGTTEIDFVSRWAELLGLNLDDHGIRLINIRGKDTLKLFEDDLRWLRNDEIFAHVCVDRDQPERPERQAEQLKTLRQFDQMGLLPTSFTVWEPNFVQHNFTTADVIEVVNRSEQAQALNFVLTEDDVLLEMQLSNDGSPRKQAKTLEKAINDLASKRTGVRLPSKGKNWGEQLAEWALGHEPPPSVSRTGNIRTIESIINLMFRGHDTDYALTAEHWKRVPESSDMRDV